MLAEKKIDAFFYWCRLEYKVHNFNAMLLLLLFLSLTLNKIKCRLISHITRSHCNLVVSGWMDVCDSMSGNRKCLGRRIENLNKKKPHHENPI